MSTFAAMKMVRSDALEGARKYLRASGTKADGVIVDEGKIKGAHVRIVWSRHSNELESVQVNGKVAEVSESALKALIAGLLVGKLPQAPKPAKKVTVRKKAPAKKVTVRKAAPKKAEPKASVVSPNFARLVDEGRVAWDGDTLTFLG